MPSHMAHRSGWATISSIIRRIVGCGRRVFTGKLPKEVTPSQIIGRHFSGSSFRQLKNSRFGSTGSFLPERWFGES